MPNKPEFDRIGYRSEIKLDIIREYAAASRRFSLALRTPAKSHRIWFGYRQYMRLVLFVMIGGWWALWDANRSALFPQIVHSWAAFADPAIQEFIFWLLPLATFSAAETIACATDKSIAGLHWTRAAILRQAFWSVIRFVVPLLLISAAFEAIFDGEVLVFVWPSAHL